MVKRRLPRNARLVLLLNALQNAADALCSVFVGVYFYFHSMDFMTVCYHYLALYAVTPVVFILAGWYSQARDRKHMFQLGMILHAVYYGALLYLQEAAPGYAVHLGVLLGITWGCFWAGQNTFNFDVTPAEDRDYFFGWLGAVTGGARLFAPLLSAVILAFAPREDAGYLVIFYAAFFIFVVGAVLTRRVPPDRERRRFRPLRALLPGRDQRDWRLALGAAAALSGSIHMFHFLLGLLLYMQTRSGASVGMYAAAQAMIGIVMSVLIGRWMTPNSRMRAMLAASLLFLAGGVLILFQISTPTLIVFGFLTAAATPLFTIPHSSIRLDVIARSVREPSERIEYLCAWEVPLALGRMAMMAALMLLPGGSGQVGLRVTLFLLAASHLVAYALVRRISFLRN